MLLDKGEIKAANDPITITKARCPPEKTLYGTSGIASPVVPCVSSSRGPIALVSCLSNDFSMPCASNWHPPAALQRAFRVSSSDNGKEFICNGLGSAKSLHLGTSYIFTQLHFPYFCCRIASVYTFPVPSRYRHLWWIKSKISEEHQKLPSLRCRYSHVTFLCYLGLITLRSRDLTIPFWQSLRSCFNYGVR